MSVLFQLFTKLHIKVFRATGGKLGGHLAGADILLLTTTGNKSGQARTVPLMYFENQGKTYIIASAAGAPAHPAWYKNLAVNPDVTVEKGAQRFAAKAVTAPDSERDAVFTKVKTQYPRFAGYEAKAGGRKIPVVRLDS
jgi:deazaflavin-dependent oxidoreductase (nitroreductase family)